MKNGAEKQMVGMTKFKAGVRRTLYIKRDQLRSPADERDTGRVKTTMEGGVGHGGDRELPKVVGRLQSHVPKAAMRDKWREPMTRTGFREALLTSLTKDLRLVSFSPRSFCSSSLPRLSCPSSSPRSCPFSSSRSVCCSRFAQSNRALWWKYSTK